MGGFSEEFRGKSEVNLVLGARYLVLGTGFWLVKIKDKRKKITVEKCIIYY